MVDPISASALIKISGLMSELYKDLAQPSIRKIGKSLGHITGFIEMPLFLLSEIPKIRMKNYLKKYEEKIQNIDEEDVCSTPEEIGIPILQKLPYCSNEQISNMFINLLYKASSTKTIQEAHPAYVKIIENLSSDEVKLILFLYNRQLIYKENNGVNENITARIPSLEIQSVTKEGTYADVNTRITSLVNLPGLMFPENSSIYLDNLVRLGLINMKDPPVANEYFYSELEIEFHKLLVDAKKLSKEFNSELKILHNYYEISNFGESFFSACTYQKDNEMIYYKALAEKKFKLYDSAISDFEKFIKISSNENDIKNAYFENGECLYLKGEYKISLENFIKIQDDKEKEYEINIKSWIALCYANMNDEANAIKFITEVEISNPTNYNVACSYSVLFRETKNSKYKELAFSKLTKSITNSIVPISHIKKDPDWIHFENDDDFKRIINNK